MTDDSGRTGRSFAFPVQLSVSVMEEGRVIVVEGILESTTLTVMVGVKTASPDSPASQVFWTFPPTWVLLMDEMSKDPPAFGVGHGVEASAIAKEPLPNATPSGPKIQTDAVSTDGTDGTMTAPMKAPESPTMPVALTVVVPTFTSM